MTRFFKVGGSSTAMTSVKFPATINWGYNEISSEKSGRAKSGLMNKKIIAVKRRIDTTWRMLDDDQASSLLKVVKKYTFVYLAYPDPFEGKDVTKRFYTDDITAECKCRNDGKYTWDISVNFIER